MLSAIIFYTPTFGTESNENSNIDEFYNTATDFLTEYYYAVDQDYDFDFSEYVSNDNFLNYLNEKTNNKKIRYGMVGCDLENYRLSFSLYEYEFFDDYVFMIVASDCKYNYANCSDDSGEGNGNQLIIDVDDYKIKDFYSFANGYDDVIRGEITKLDDPNFWENDDNYNAIAEKQQEQNVLTENYYADLFGITSSSNQVISNSSTPSPSSNQVVSNSPIFSPPAINSVSATWHALDKTAIVNWARANFNKTNPTTGNSNQVSSYYDFSTISGNFDCTNFVSHAILAGGTPVYDTGGSGISSSGWYFRSISNRSSSWSGVSNLYSFLTSNTTRGPYGTALSYSNYGGTSANTNWAVGDVLQFHDGSIWRHSTIITSSSPVIGSLTPIEARVTGRTSSISRNDNQRQSEIYNGQSRRVIKLNGYRT
jgi:hypothetical protein